MLMLLVSCFSAPGDTALLGETGVFVDTVVNSKAVGTPTWPIDSTSPTICYHYPGSGAHRASGGMYNADDTYALDLNCSGNAESGRGVHPVRSGTVREVSSAYGWVLIEHPESVTVDGVTYSSFYSGYLHMSGVSVSVGSSVTTGSTIGRVSNTGTSGVHLHMAVYVGTWTSSSDNSRLVSFDPSTLGGDFSSYSYAPYVWRRWVDAETSNATYQLVEGGTSSDLYGSSSYGMFGGMRYTTSRTGTADDNTFEYKFNVLTPAARGYYAWPYIPSNYGTVRNATYRVLSGTSASTSAQSELSRYSVNQLSISNDYARSSKISIDANRYVTVKLGDATGESSRYVGADLVALWWKADHCLGLGCAYAGSASAYCYQSNYESTSSSSSCTLASTLPSGF